MRRASRVEILGGVALVAGGAFWLLTAALDERIEAARAERTALETEAAALRVRIAQWTADDARGRVALPLVAPVTERADAVLAAQRIIADLAARHGVTVSGFTEANLPDGLSRPAFALRGEGEGDYGDVSRFLAALEAEVTALGLSHLSLRPMTGEAGMTALGFVAWGFLEGGNG